MYVQAWMQCRGWSNAHTILRRHRARPAAVSGTCRQLDPSATGLSPGRMASPAADWAACKPGQQTATEDRKCAASGKPSGDSSTRPASKRETGGAMLSRGVCPSQARNRVDAYWHGGLMPGQQTAWTRSRCRCAGREADAGALEARRRTLGPRLRRRRSHHSQPPSMAATTMRMSRIGIVMSSPLWLLPPLLGSADAAHAVRCITKGWHAWLVGLPGIVGGWGCSQRAGQAPFEGRTFRCVIQTSNLPPCFHCVS